MMREFRSMAIGTVVGAVAVALAWGASSFATPVAAQTPGAPATAPSSQVDQQLAELRRLVQGVDVAAQRAQVIAVVNQLNGVDLHELDEGLDAGKPIPPTALGQVRRARTSVQAINWPATARSTVNRLADEMTKLETALRDENADRAKEPAHNSHDLAHDLSDLAFSWLGSR